MKYSQIWKPHWPEYSVQVKQVYGFLFDENNKLFVLNDRGKYNLPGGKPQSEETWLETLTRECIEEGQVTFTTPLLLGHVHVVAMDSSNETEFAQLRFIAKVDRLLENKPDPSTGRQYKREFYSIGEAERLLNWGRHGTDQFRMVEYVWSYLAKSHGR